MGTDRITKTPEALVWGVPTTGLRNLTRKKEREAEGERPCDLKVPV